MNIGKAIKEIRKGQKLSQSNVASRANITQATLSQIENGKRPGIETLKSLSNALNVPESLIYINALEKEDVPPEKQLLYDNLFPIIRKMVLEVAGS